MLQCSLVQPRDNGAALSILTDADDVALFVVYGDRLSFRRTKADGVYDYLFRRGLPGRRNGITLMILTVRHNDDDLLTRPLIAEAGHRRLDSLGDHGALPGDRIRACVIQVGPGGGVIGRQRELDEAGAGEQDNANLVAVQL